MSVRSRSCGQTTTTSVTNRSQLDDRRPGDAVDRELGERRRSRHDLDTVRADERSVLGLRAAGDRGVPGDGTRVGNDRGAARDGEDLAPAVPREPALVVVAPLVREA